MKENENAEQSSVKFKTIITSTGKEKIAQAVLTGGKVDIETAVLTDGGGNYFLPDENMTEMHGEVWRGPIKRKRVNAAMPNIIEVTVFLDGTVGGWTARGIGLLDSEGDLIAVGNMPDTIKALVVDGAAATMTICMRIAVSNADAMEFKIDPSGLTVSEERFEEALEAMKVALGGKAASSHTHDGRYYTETETNNLLADKAASSHTHTKAQVGLGNVDNTADSAKSVNYAASAGYATSAGSAVDQTARNSASSAQTTDSNAMPKAGGTFTGNTVAYATNRNTSLGCLRNCVVVSTGSSPTANLVSTNALIFSRA